MKFLALGGWCGTTMGLRGNKLYNVAYPFDHIRSTFEGVINCIENDFSNFFPKRIERDVIDNYKYSGKSFRGRYMGFYHHDLTDQTVISDFNRRIVRFYELLKTTNEKIIFVRTICSHNYNDEINLTKKFINAIDMKYKNLDYMLIFIIPGQEKSMYYKRINENIFIFTLNDNSENNDNLTVEYKPIYHCILNYLLKGEIPRNNEIDIKNTYNRFVEVDGIKIVREDM